MYDGRGSPPIKNYSHNKAEFLRRKKTISDAASAAAKAALPSYRDMSRSKNGNLANSRRISNSTGSINKNSNNRTFSVASRLSKRRTSTPE